jgi:hypothetical protein
LGYMVTICDEAKRQKTNILAYRKP